MTGRVWIAIPALDEQASIGRVVAALVPDDQRVVVVCDNGSRDRTAEVAREHGAVVVPESRRGYGQACLTAIQEIRRRGAETGDLLAFVDADFSDDPTQLAEVLAPLIRDEADLVIGSRTAGRAEPGALLPQARWGNWLAGHWIRAVTGVRFTDLGPFRALRWEVYESLNMQDRAFGWTVEMQLKAANAGYRCAEVPVNYRKRIGRSKITGTVRGTVMASITILSILARWSFWKPKP